MTSADYCVSYAFLLSSLLFFRSTSFFVNFKRYYDIAYDDLQCGIS